MRSEGGEELPAPLKVDGPYPVQSAASLNVSGGVDFRCKRKSWWSILIDYRTAMLAVYIAESSD
jgi:hypothetical protein